MATLERLGVEPAEAVFLDDIGLNLKAAKQLGIHTILVLYTTHCDCNSGLHIIRDKFQDLYVNQPIRNCYISCDIFLSI